MERKAMKISADMADVLFRGLFCLIFVGLGAEHLFSDDLIRRLMPTWVPFERAVSIMGWVRSPEMRHLITEYGIIV